MRTYKRVLATVLASSLFLTNLPTVTFAEDSSSAEVTSDDAEDTSTLRGNKGKKYEIPEVTSLGTWEGVPELQNKEYDTWDGTMDSFDWFLDHKGTEDDPYVIDSAEDLQTMRRMWYTVEDYDPNYKDASEYWEFIYEPDTLADYYGPLGCTGIGVDRSNHWYYIIDPINNDSFRETGDTSYIGSFYSNNNKTDYSAHMRMEILSYEQSAPDVVAIGSDSITYQYFTSIVAKFTINGVTYKEVDVVPLLLAAGKIDGVSAPSKRAYASSSEYSAAGEPNLRYDIDDFHVDKFYKTKWSAEAFTISITDMLTGDTDVVDGHDYNAHLAYGDVQVTLPGATVATTMSVEDIFSQYDVRMALTEGKYARKVTVEATRPEFTDDTFICDNSAYDGANTTIYASSNKYKGSAVNTLINGYSETFSIKIPYSTWFTKSRVTTKSAFDFAYSVVQGSTSSSSTYYRYYQETKSVPKSHTYYWFLNKDETEPFEETWDYYYVTSMDSLKDITYDITYTFSTDTNSKWYITLSWESDEVDANGNKLSGVCDPYDITSYIGSYQYMGYSATTPNYTYYYYDSRGYRRTGNAYTHNEYFLVKNTNGSTRLNIPIKFRTSYATNGKDSSDILLQVPFINIEEPANDLLAHPELVNVSNLQSGAKKLSDLDDYTFYKSSNRYTPAQHSNMVYRTLMSKYAKDYFNSQYASKKEYMEAAGESKASYEAWEEEPFYINKHFKLAADIDFSDAPGGFLNLVGLDSYRHGMPSSFVGCDFDLNGYTLKVSSTGFCTNWDLDSVIHNGSIYCSSGLAAIGLFLGTMYDIDIYSPSAVDPLAETYCTCVSSFGGYMYDCNLYVGSFSTSSISYDVECPRLIENTCIYVLPYNSTSSYNNVTLFQGVTANNVSIIASDKVFSGMSVYMDLYDSYILGLNIWGDIYLYGSCENTIIADTECRQFYSTCWNKGPNKSDTRLKDSYIGITIINPGGDIIYGNSSTTVYDSCTFDIAFDYSKCSESTNFLYTDGLYYGSYKNCDINIQPANDLTRAIFDCADTSVPYHATIDYLQYDNVFENCVLKYDIPLTVPKYNSAGSKYDLMRDASYIDCDIYYELVRNRDLLGYNCDATNCNIVVNKMIYDEYDYDYGNVAVTGSAKNCNIIVENLSGYYAGLCADTLEDSTVHVTFDDKLFSIFDEISDNYCYSYYYTSSSPGNNEFYFEFSDTVSGNIGSLLRHSYGLKNSLIYVDDMPSTCAISHHTLIWGYDTSEITDVTLICPKLNVGNTDAIYKMPFVLMENTSGFSTGTFTGYTREQLEKLMGEDSSKVVFDYEEYTDDAGNLLYKGRYMGRFNNRYSSSGIDYEGVSAYCNLYPADCITNISATAVTYSLNRSDLTLNVYNKDGRPANVAVSAACRHGSGNVPGVLNNVILRSNTTNPYSGVYSTGYAYSAPSLLRSIYLDLPNAQCTNKSGEYAQPGFITPYGFYSEPFINVWDSGNNGTVKVNRFTNLPEYVPYYYGGSIVWNTYRGTIQFSHCYVPEGQSGFSSYRLEDGNKAFDTYSAYSYDVNNAVTSWENRVAVLKESGASEEEISDAESKLEALKKIQKIAEYRYYLHENNYSDYNKKLEELGKPEEYYVELPDPGIDTKLAATADSDGTLAYLLDNGQSVKFRTTNWTVMEPDTWLVHPITGEKLFKFPVQTCLTSLGNNPATLTDTADFGAIYKTTIIPAEHGNVAIAGINGVPVTEGFIYSKPNQPMVASITPDSDNFILAYATHKLGEGNTARITSTKLAVSTFASSVDESYTIEGYSQQGIDTVITPVFKEKFTITVDIEDSEHGTVTVPYTVSTEGELLTVELDVEPGYTITDLQLNGNPLTESKFYMPAENVIITGKCVPFEGGITEFYLMGSAGTINHIEQTINVTVPTSPYICNALPTIAYVGDYLTPSESARQDFSNASETPVTYTVHYGDNQTMSYDVYVHQTPKTQKIYEFSLLGVNGEVDNANNRIKVRVPSGTDLSNLKPDLISYSADAISADETVARDFGVPQMYTLTTAGMQARTYTVIAEEMSGTDAYIDEFKVSGIQGDIDEETKTITLNIPKMMNLTNIQPDYISYVGSSINPSKAAEVNLEDNATYTVQSLSGTSTTYDVKLNRSGNSEAVITEFKLAGIDGLIDETAKTITVPVPVTTNVAGIAPDVLTFTGKSIYPVPTAVQDFTQPVTYTVVAQDNTEAEYEIIIQPLTSEGKLLEFELQGYPGVIDEDAKTVTITDFPRDLNLKDIVPSKFVTSAEATSDPDANTPQDFTKPVEYEVSSKYGDDVNTYTVNVVLEALNKDARIDRFVIDGHEATIDQINGMITLELPSTYKPADISSIVPEIEWVGETLNPDENDAQNFNQAITYTVTAEDPQIQREYDVVVTIEQVSEHDPYIIEAFSILGYAGLVNQDTGAIDIHVPYSKAEDIKYTVPTIVWHADKITPADNRANDFSTQQTYTVTNKAGLAKSYYVNVHLDSSSGPVTPIQGNPSITRFELCGAQGVIDQAAATIKVTVFTSDSFDPSLDHDIPDGITFVGDSISPDVTEPQDFTKPVSYTVTDEGVTKTYQVIVEKKPASDEQCIINKFTLLGVDGTIDQTAKTIKFQFTEDKRNELKSAIPTIDWEGTTIIPNEGVALDFTTVRTYTVSTSNDSKTYTVTVDIGDGSDFNDEYPYITRFNLLGVNGNIDQDARTITFEFDWAYYEQLINTDATIIWRGDTITPDGATKMDYTTPKRFTVSKGDQSKTYTVTVTLTGTPPAGLDCSIDKFTLLGVDGAIDQTAKTIKFTFPESAKENLLNTVPVIEWTGSSISPKANAAQNFTVPISYTVKNIDATASKTYAVTVEFTPDTDDNDPNNICIIDKFTLCGYTGSINQTNGTIVVQLPTSKAEEIKSAVPSIVWRGETITPTESTAQDFSNPVKYRVTAKNTAKFKDYTVTVAFTGVDGACDINRFILCGIDGVIDRIDRTITVTVPYKEKANLSKAVPVIDWTGTKLTPDEKTAMNFNVPVKYTVSCEDSSLTKTYIVRVYVDEPDTDCSINSFALLGKSATVDQTTRTITLTLDKETFEDRIKNAVPTIGWSGESITPKGNAPQDFSKDIFYTVTAEDPDISKTYTVHVELDDQREPLITNFRLYSYAGYINQFTGVIKVKLPYSYKDKLNNAVPYIEWEGEKITPGDNVAQNFNGDVTYVVSVGDKEKSYAVQVEYDADTTCKITKFTLLGEKGRINQSSGNIYIDMPYDKSEDLANAVPEITWEGETLTPDERAAQNFNSDIVYTVTAENEDYSKQYTVIVQVEEPEEEDPEGEDPDEEDDDDGDEDEGDDDGDEDEENPVPPVEDGYNPGTLPPPINKDDEDEEDEDTPNTGVGFNTGSLLGFLAASTAVAIFGKRYTKRKTKK